MNTNTPFTVYRDDLQIADTHRHTCSYQSGWRFHYTVTVMRGIFEHRMRRGCCEPAHTGSGENTNVPVLSVQQPPQERAVGSLGCRRCLGCRLLCSLALNFIYRQTNTRELNHLRVVPYEWSACDSPSSSPPLSESVRQPCADPRPGKDGWCNQSVAPFMSSE